MKSVIKKTLVHEQPAGAVRTQHAAVTPTSGADRPAPTPGVRVVHVDGRVAALEVTCKCGQVAVVELDYDTHAAG